MTAAPHGHRRGRCGRRPPPVSAALIRGALADAAAYREVISRADCGDCTETGIQARGEHLYCDDHQADADKAAAYRRALTLRPFRRAGGRAAPGQATSPKGTTAMNEPVTTITGNLTADPELRFTPAGHQVVSFTIAATPRYRDTASGEWKDAETWFVRCSAWRDLGANIAECLTRGAAVVATGRLRSRSWQADDGSKRSVVEMQVDDLGPSLRRATAKVIRTTREHAPADGTAAPADGQWSAPAAPMAPAGGLADEAPF